MNDLNRRRFIHLAAGPFLFRPDLQLTSGGHPAQIFNQDGSLQIKGSNYIWEYEQKNDHFRLLDSKNRLITTGTVQPLVVVAPSNDPTVRQCSPGSLIRHHTDSNHITFEYGSVNGGGSVSTTWRFDDRCLWIEAIRYETQAMEDVVSLHYFAKVKAGKPHPSLRSSFAVLPGVSEGSAISPILRRDIHLNETIWLGRGSSVQGLLQQWGLPVHYFGGFSIAENEHARDVYVEKKSDSFVCGLADLPNADFFLDLDDGLSSVWLDYRSDLWKHVRVPGALTLGATLVFTVGTEARSAIGEYYAALVNAGIIKKRQNSAKKNSVALSPQFCTWGAQVARNKAGERLDQAFLDDIYSELRASGMKTGMFSIDDKWEGRYGKLEHSAERLPHFEKFLDQVRADGNHIGLWAALMRCEKPSDIGLTEEHMLKGIDGAPIPAGGGSYFILDFTQPEVAEVLSNLARQFIRRYKPDLVKFDFGYELPALSKAAPKDKRWAGERMMWKGLDVVIKAMRQENPDLVVMYYQLSPLFLEYFDLHSPDDLFLTSGEYDVEANRRFFFSSLLGELGVPTYGSSGYDWESMPNIWFDSSVVGTLGCMSDFAGDERGEKASPSLVAKYNGLTHALRASNVFKVVPLDGATEAATLGAHSGSWVRFENDKVVLLAIRPEIRVGDRTASPLRSLVDCSMPVVVASQTEEDIANSAKLAVVPYGAGQISITCQKGHSAQLLSHHFGGAVTRTQVPIENARLNLTVSKELLEWIEIQIVS